MGDSGVGLDAARLCWATWARSLEGLIRVAANGSTVTRTSGRPCPPTRYLAADEWTLMKEQRFEIMVPSQNPPAGVFLARGWVGHHTPLLARRVLVGHHTRLPLVAGNVTLRNQTANAA